MVLAKYMVTLGRWATPIEPEQVLCNNLNCMNRLFDLALPYTVVAGNESYDISIKCKCGTMNYIRLGKVVRV